MDFIRKKKYGKIWLRLADMLDCDPEDIWMRHAKTARMDGSVLWGVDLPGKELSSFDCMSDCVKYGFTISDGEITAKDIDLR